MFSREWKKIRALMCCEWADVSLGISVWVAGLTIWGNNLIFSFKKGLRKTLRSVQLERSIHRESNWKNLWHSSFIYRLYFKTSLMESRSSVHIYLLIKLTVLKIATANFVPAKYKFLPLRGLRAGSETVGGWRERPFCLSCFLLLSLFKVTRPAVLSKRINTQVQLFSFS